MKTSGRPKNQPIEENWTCFTSTPITKKRYYFGTENFSTRLFESRIWIFHSSGGAKSFGKSRCSPEQGCHGVTGGGKRGSALSHTNLSSLNLTVRPLKIGAHWKRTFLLGRVSKGIPKLIQLLANQKNFWGLNIFRSYSRLQVCSVWNFGKVPPPMVPRQI